MHKKHEIQPQTPFDHEEQARSSTRNIALVGALIASVAIGAGKAETAEATQTLRSISELPGYGLNTVSPETRKKLDNSTQDLMSKYGTAFDSRYPYEDTGKTTRVKFGKSSYFLFSNKQIGIGSVNGSVYIPANPLPSARYGTEVTGKSFAFGDAKAGGVLADIPFGFATKISVNTRGNNVALAKAKSSDTPEQTGMQLSDVRAITWKGMKNAKLGQKITLMSGDKIGRFVGTTMIRDDVTHKLMAFYVVAAKNNAKTTASGYAPDGSIAIASNATTGPMSFTLIDTINGTSFNGETPDQSSFELRHAIEQDVEVNLAGRSIYLFAKTDLGNMIKGFGNDAKQYGVQGF